MEDVAKYRSELQNAGTNYTEKLQAFKEGRISKGELKTAKKQLDTAEKNYLVAGAKQADISARLQLPQETYSGTSAHFDKQANESLMMSREHPLNKMNELGSLSGQMMNMIGMQVGQYLQQLVSSIWEIMSSKATEMQAQQKVTEEQFDQIRDIFSQLLEVVRKSIEMFAAVTNKESQTIEDIMNNFKA